MKLQQIESPLDDYLDTVQMAAVFRMQVKSFQNHRLAEVKANCRTRRSGRKIYAHAADFARYANRATNLTNPSV